LAVLTGGVSGFETGLDRSSRDLISTAEADGLFRWYAETHGEGNLDLARFVPLLVEQRPGAFKRYRTNSEVVRGAGEGLPLFAVALLFLHSYVVIADERGAFYEVIAARAWGALKVEVLDTIEFAFLQAGAVGVNALAALSERYLHDWPDDEPRQDETAAWPDGWTPAAAGAHEAGLNYDTPGLSATEQQRLYDWYQRQGRPIPLHVRFLAQHHPHALKTQRDRYEHARTNSELPEQLYPLLQLHTATIRGQAETIHSAALEARELGVTKTQVLEALLFAFLYSNDEIKDLATKQLEPLLRTWPT
jgi:hypothetical protein